jgi:hypothetical protein
MEVICNKCKKIVWYESEDGFVFKMPNNIYLCERCHDKPLKMILWIQNKFYKELMAMPIWTLTVFGDLKDGDVLKPDDVRYKLITMLVSHHIKQAPLDIYDEEYSNTWKTSDYKDIVKRAVKELQMNKNTTIK